MGLDGAQHGVACSTTRSGVNGQLPEPDVTYLEAGARDVSQVALQPGGGSAASAGSVDGGPGIAGQSRTAPPRRSKVQPAASVPGRRHRHHRQCPLERRHPDRGQPRGRYPRADADRRRERHGQSEVVAEDVVVHGRVVGSAARRQGQAVGHRAGSRAISATIAIESGRDEGSVRRREDPLSPGGGAPVRLACAAHRICGSPETGRLIGNWAATGRRQRSGDRLRRRAGTHACRTAPGRAPGRRGGGHDRCAEGRTSVGLDRRAMLLPAPERSRAGVGGCGSDSIRDIRSGTLGHVDIIRRACSPGGPAGDRHCHQSRQRPLFTLEERGPWSSRDARRSARRSGSRSWCIRSRTC